jgi:hypothetical protein
MPSQNRSSNTSSEKRNEKGVRIHPWVLASAITVTVATLLALFVGVLQWGLKLEEELNVERQARAQSERDLLRRIAVLERRVGEGILPRAEERIEALDDELNEHKQDHE